jgi:hypothetical protein
MLYPVFKEGVMARNLYRIYLYTVFIAMLIFAAVGLGMLLQALLSFTPLRGEYGSIPTHSTIVQVTVFFAVSWLIAALFGGLHYWLIRRDMHSDPVAGRSAIRAFFLNITELIDAPLAVYVSSSAVIAQFGHDPAFDLTGSAAFAAVTLLLLVVLELERQRAQAGPGAAMAFQRLHLYGAQLILLIILTSSWFNTVSQLVDAFVFGGQAGGVTPCGKFSGCQGPNLLFVVASTLFIVLFWVGYGYITRNDSASLLRRILHFASFTFGMGLLFYGISKAIELGFLALFGVILPAIEIQDNYNFTAYITLGLLVAGVYTMWFRIAARKKLEGFGWATTTLIDLAIITALFAGAFWWGIAFVLLNAFESLGGVQPGPRGWAPALALIVTGLAYIPLDLYLHRCYKQDPALAADPRRGFVFVLIGGGILSAAIGGAVALYSLLTDFLGSPLENWQYVARVGTSAFIVGVLIVASYLWTARREHLFSGLIKRSASEEMPSHVEPEPLPTQLPPAEISSTIDEVLDDLLAGKITRDEAANRMQSLINKEVSST